MPTLGGVTQTGESAYGTVPFGWVQSPDSNGAATSIFVTPLVPDETQYPDVTADAASTLRDFTEGQDWFLKRIVGKVFLRTRHDTTATQGQAWPNLRIACAFFVGKSKDDTPDDPDFDNTEIDPLGSQNVRQPWIWRRVWHLSTGAPYANAAVGTQQVAAWPNMNLFGPGLLDGPHIDAKTARRIRREERLWFVSSVQGYQVVPGADGQSVEFGDDVAVIGDLDYRILGAMRKSTNRSTF